MSATMPVAANQPPVMLRLLPGVLLIAILLVLFRDTVGEMIATYDRSETFAHAYLVPPISAWLIWRQRHLLATLPIRPMPWVLPLMGGACLLWLLGELAAVNAASQLALVSLIILTVPAMYGWAVTRALMFPLFFLYFAVPIGMFLVPLMMEHTANFTVAALQFTGVPVYREGLQFVIPSGNWSVVEACSGVRYLIASFMVGTLFAYLNYHSWKRRLLFIAVSIAVPVVANWFRAYMIVMLGHVSGNTLAVGVDHLIYGWVFFGLIIGIMFMIGSRWAQYHEPMPAPDAGAPANLGMVQGRQWPVAAAVLAVLVAAHGVLWTLDQPRGPLQSELTLPDDLASPWKGTEDSITAWVPAYSGARSTAERTYRAPANSAAGDAAQVGVWAGYYRDQGKLNKLVTSSNALSRVEESNWAQVSNGTQTLTVAGRQVQLRKTLLRGPGEPGSASAQRLLVLHAYWLGGDALSASDVRAKILMAFNRLRGAGDDSAALMFFVPAGNTPQSLEDAQATLTQFAQTALPKLTSRLVAIQNGSAGR